MSLCVLSAETFSLDEQMMLGPAVLVRPVVTAGAGSVDVVLPRASRWYDHLTGVEMEKSGWLPGSDHVFRVTVRAHTYTNIRTETDTQTRTRIRSDWHLETRTPRGRSRICVNTRGKQRQ